MRKIEELLLVVIIVAGLAVAAIACLQHL